MSSAKDDTVSNTLLKLLITCKNFNPEFLDDNKGYLVISRLDFPNDWGLGSSSTLINNLANWAQVDAYQLLKTSFGGSGYDIACAQHQAPITYQLIGEQPHVESVAFQPEFSEHLYFVHFEAPPLPQKEWL